MLTFLQARIVGGIILGLIVIGAAFVFVSTTAPGNFVPNTFVHVSPNTSLASIGNLLQSQHVIKSTILFRVAVAVVGGTHPVNAGDYFFPARLSVWQVAERLTQGNQGLTMVKITFPEGTSVRGMGEIVAKTLDSSTTSPQFLFDKNKFMQLASSSEGYLFPDTYFFSPNVSPAGVISLLKANFDRKINSILPEITANGRSVRDTVIMASILEREALKDADRRVIAGILWKRLDSGQLLQVDPPFAYAIGKTSDALTSADLQIDSPYNTYKHKGLPPTPINNPGIEALIAAANPTPTTYWYYLSDKKGIVHYATTYDEHLANRAKYLGK